MNKPGMMRPQRWINLIGAGVFFLASTAALAQSAVTTNYTSFEATSDKPVQLGVYASAHKNCTPAPLPKIRMVEPPKIGTFTVRQARLTTNKVAGCPGLQIPAQVVSYQARANHSGSDHVVYQVTNFNGEIGLYDVTLEVKEAKPAPPNDGKT